MDLTTSVSELANVGEIYAKRLSKLGILTLEDLLMHVPFRYEDFTNIKKISTVKANENVTIHAKIESITNITTKRGRKAQLVIVFDETGKMQILWFNQPYILYALKTGSDFAFSGNAQWFNKKLTLFAPVYEPLSSKSESIHTGRIVPIYHTTNKINSKWIRTRIFHLLKNDFEEFLPEDILKKHNLMDFTNAVKTVHFPEKSDNIENARKRLAFNEFFMQQIKWLMRAEDRKKFTISHKINIPKSLYLNFVNSLPFKLTQSQERSIKEIFEDLKKKTPMNRLVEGDVGSGKTVVAGAAAFAAFTNGFQSVFMAPTQILAEQHYNTLSKLFAPYKGRVSLITSTKKSIEMGRSDIFVGTHALIYKKIDFDKVALVVIDESHRFGVNERAKIAKIVSKNKKSPHILTMTATPIPRTIALTVYGDLDLSTLDELPKGRKPITTWIVPPEKRNGAYEWISKEIDENKVQAFIVCPLIDESQVETLKEIKAVKTEFEKLQNIFKDKRLGLLHGKLKSKEKEKVLEDFRKGSLDILVSTPVVEVGIDIPNATIMVIEAAERFGLAQLHQLRGRVGRGEKKSYCLLFTESKSEKVNQRLLAMKKSISGFELAEIDLQMRGPGEIYGVAQHGFPQLKVATWQDSNLIKLTRLVAQEAISDKNKFAKVFEKLNKLEVNLN
ncbi:MAG: ATP-dependent DNA helicase RecG [Patescibacteria group bacterium]|nr:ATP-dependent DNA helicase RecG [Patescibacteria group bacterium]